jgi:AcrR family transcriptional regulator
MASDPIRSPVRAPRNRAGVQTRAVLLSEAERLFAERGIEHVAVRDITEAAGANIAAINYHFGSKRGLIEALVDRGAGEMNRRRDAYLDALESGPAFSLRPLVEALVMPTVEMVQSTADGRYYSQFLSRLATSPEFLALVNEAHDPHTNRFLSLLERVTPDLEPKLRLLRFVAAKDMVNQFVGEPTGRIPAWLSSHVTVDFDETVAALIDMIVGLFAAPVTNPASATANRRPPRSPRAPSSDALRE